MNFAACSDQLSFNFTVYRTLELKYQPEVATGKVKYTLMDNYFVCIQYKEVYRPLHLSPLISVFSATCLKTTKTKMMTHTSSFILAPCFIGLVFEAFNMA
jgi:hypothetical protein